MKKSKELGVDISFAVCDEHGLPRVYRRYGEALVLSITLVPGKAYTAAVTQCKTKDVAAAAAEGASLMAIQTNDPRITLVAGGYPLFEMEKLPAALESEAVQKNRTLHRRICGICFQRAGKIIRGFEKGEERSSLFLYAHFSPEYANKLLT